MCDAVDISDDEDSFLLENDAGITPKDESLGYDLPPLSSRPREVDVASSSGTNLRSSFIGMGFAPSLVDKAIEAKGEENGELILETLFAYSDFHKSESSESLGSLFGEDTKDKAYCESHIPLKVEHDAIAGDNVIDEKTLSLLKMNFSLDEVRFAMQRLGESAPVGRLMDFIFAARMARKYEKDTDNSIPGNEESGKDYNNEVIFGIMEKSLQLLEMGFSENDISGALERCGSEAPAALLAESIVTGGTCPLPDKYSSTYLSTSSAQRSAPSSKRKMEECDLICIKTEAYSSGMASHVGTSDLLETPEDNTPDVDIIDELINFKKPKEEVLEDSGNSLGRMMLEARIGHRPSSSVRNRAPVIQRQAAHISSIEEGWKPAVSLPNPRRNLTNALAKPPYFLYRNVTNDKSKSRLLGQSYSVHLFASAGVCGFSDVLSFEQKGRLINFFHHHLLSSRFSILASSVISTLFINLMLLSLIIRCMSLAGNFTPVCTTELGAMAAYADKFSKLGVKLLGLSADDVASHKAWIKDIEAYCNGCKVTYPIAADPNRKIIEELNMVDPDEKDSSGNNVPSRALHIVGPDKKIKLSFLYPASTGRNMDEVVRVVESLQRAAAHKIATPANWKPGEAVVISPSVSEEEAKKMFPQGYKSADLPSNKPFEIH